MSQHDHPVCSHVDTASPARGSGRQSGRGGGADASSPRWSPDGTRLLYRSNGSGRPQRHLHTLSSGAEQTLTSEAQATWAQRRQVTREDFDPGTTTLGWFARYRVSP